MMDFTATKSALLRTGKLRGAWLGFRVVVFVVLVALITYALIGLRGSVHSFGSVDFFYYLCTSRDRVFGRSGRNLAAYGYFPGVYVVWSSLMILGNFALSFLQQAYLGAIVLNAVLLGWLGFLMTSKLLLSLCAVVLYLFGAAYTEGVEGCTEIFCTIPFLAGLVAWSILMRKGRQHSAMISLGVLAAFSLFMKQQALLLLVGGVALLPLIFSKANFVYLRASHLLVGVVAFVVTFLGCFLVEGGGLPALLQGLSLIQTYEMRSSFGENIKSIYPFMPLVGCVSMALFFWLVFLFHLRRANDDEQLLGAILGVLLLSGAASLYQFSTRGYLHYALLTGPCFALVCCLGLFLSLRGNGSVAGLLSLARTVLCLAVCWLPLVVGWNETRHIRKSVEALSSRPTADQVMQPFLEVCKVVPPDTELFIFPPRRNIIHWFCRTKSTAWPLGYGWADVDIQGYKRTLSNPELKYVFVLSPDSEDYNMPMVISLRGAPFEELLKAEGFSLGVRLASGDIFIR